MFYLLTLGSLLGYALQTTLMVRFARKIDGLTLAAVRNGSFAVTLLPLLWFSSVEGFSAVFTEWPLLLLSSFAGAVGLHLSYQSYRSLPAGVGGALTSAASTLTTMLAGQVFFDEILTTPAVILILLIVCGCVSLGLQKIDHPHLDSRFVKGITYAVITGPCFATTKLVLAALSRSGDPMAATYVWEVMIAPAALALWAVRPATKDAITIPTLRQIGIISLCALPTLAGSGLYAIAARLGPVAVLNAVSAGGVLAVVALLSVFLYRERLTVGQSVSIAVIIGGIAGLRFL